MLTNRKMDPLSPAIAVLRADKSSMQYKALLMGALRGIFACRNEGGLMEKYVDNALHFVKKAKEVYNTFEIQEILSAVEKILEQTMVDTVADNAVWLMPVLIKAERYLDDGDFLILAALLDSIYKDRAWKGHTHPFEGSGNWFQATESNDIVEYSNKFDYLFSFPSKTAADMATLARVEEILVDVSNDEPIVVRKKSAVGYLLHEIKTKRGIIRLSTKGG